MTTSPFLKEVVIAASSLSRQEQRTLRHLRELMMRAYGRDLETTHQAICALAARIQKTYGHLGCLEYHLYCMMVTATLSESTTKFDLPGEYSVEKLIRSFPCEIRRTKRTKPP